MDVRIDGIGGTVDEGGRGGLKGKRQSTKTKTLIDLSSQVAAIIRSIESML